MKMNFKIYIPIIFASLVVITSCKKDDKTTDPTLYTRLGGIDAISAVTDKFLSNVVADNAINARFTATVADEYRLESLRNNLIDQICAGAGGPCQYKGKTMAAAHAGMNITPAEFNALVADLSSALDFYKVSAKDKTDLLAILAPMQADVVGK